jgi:hypothetical protein
MAFPVSLRKRISKELCRGDSVNSKKGGQDIMKYENPSVVVLGSAAGLVQNSEDKTSILFQDNITAEYNVTAPAYQADE